MRLSKMDGWLFLIGLVVTLLLVLVADKGPRHLPVLYFFLLVLLSIFGILLFYLSMARDMETVLKIVGI